MPLKLASLLALCGLACVPCLAQAQATAHNASCKVDTANPSDADIAMYRGDYAKAGKLYAEAMKANPADQRSHQLWIDTLIDSRKLDEARKNTEAWTDAEPKSARAISTASELRHAEGDWLEAYVLALKAAAIDPCIPDIYGDLAEYEGSAGYHATARKHLALAHQLAPNDEMVQIAWIDSLDDESSFEQLKTFIQTSKSISDAVRKKSAQRLNTLNALRQNKCELSSMQGPAVIPMMPIQHEYQMGVPYYGLEVAFNGHKRTLQIDTGASGFLLTRSATTGAGLTKIDTARVGGFGDQDSNGTTTSTVQTVRIGGLTFKNCSVESLNASGVLGGEAMGLGKRLDLDDGLVGIDIFARYLVTVDYIKHEIRLEPLPASPAEASVPLDALGGVGDRQAIVADRIVPANMKTWTSIYRNGHMLIVPTRINSKLTRLFVLDTGAESNLIDEKFAAEVSTNQESGYSMRGLSGTSKIGETGKFTLDFANIRLPIQSMDSTNLSKFDGIAGFLGYPTLEQLVLHIDYRDNLILFEAPTARKL